MYGHPYNRYAHPHYNPYTAQGYHHPPPLRHRPYNPYYQPVIEENRTPYHLRPDLRYPTEPPSDPKEPTTLYSPDGEFATHLLLLLVPHPPKLEKVLASSRKKRAETLDTVLPEDLITRAVSAQKLRHVSDGPKGGIWLVEPGHEGIVTAMVEELEALKDERKKLGSNKCGVEEDKAGGKWEVLGVGRGGDEGRVFLVHACGLGPTVIEEKKPAVKGKGGKGGGGEGKKKKKLLGRILGKI
ncbi:MAG: hypothetical protein Q9166_000898 [cf. Caloplaca sp. 2 TL-2023]